MNNIELNPNPNPNTYPFRSPPLSEPLSTEIGSLPALGSRPLNRGIPKALRFRETIG
jgi:hypothetical protein